MSVDDGGEEHRRSHSSAHALTLYVNRPINITTPN
jgi:hypothetical protein